MNHRWRPRIRCQSSHICWWYAAVCWNGWRGLSRPALVLHQLPPALVPAQPPATERKQVWLHHHWNCSVSCSVAAAIRDECRREQCRSQHESEALCMTFDRTMSFDKHVSSVVHACNSICLAYGTSGHLSLMRSHTRSPAASCDPDLTTATHCYSTVPTEILTSCSVCRIIWPMSFATLVA